MDSYERYLPIFQPRVVAVVGASASGGVTPGNEFIRHSRAFGFDGRMVPIHPSASSVEGLPAAKWKRAGLWSSAWSRRRAQRECAF
jgi:acyl-CoA synthetase (NDP forming)